MELNNITPLLCARCQHFAVHGEIGEVCDCCKNEGLLQPPSPDKKKLTRLASIVGNLEIPSIANKTLQQNIETQRDKFASWLMLCADNI